MRFIVGIFISFSPEIEFLPSLKFLTDFVEICLLWQVMTP
ncbi:hypothetical protein SPAR9_1686 [Streptococcus pneumoniae GA06083]|uniref:Uncharacterized protein n=1 Tax=Streptococcus pneumoniae (strain JJA) TaxID=488222 RepID=C1CG27_STRZJ|nr:hypothetical protein SPJ_1705 [Streptococcus pneumoniae JJA]ANO37579.1 hypothetical protein SPND219_01834 [Streptococcus pneumoniae]EDT51281.1 hypothetical protein SP187300_1858 [Streptococcus pneumoniae CDC1873-00]EDT93336.1 hypothetical protein SP195_1757 [Streptococcus pneumoniae SP195]EDT96330.1 hypothetical protein SP305906_1747 [Streptococcus pneumoniae CDC3059-06]EGI83106.1 hypothetical protein SPAR50_1795 [Streptococcus pneumoniae GA17570]EHD26841.1 hypothetical protein SPAR19_1789